MNKNKTTSFLLLLGKFVSKRTITKKDIIKSIWIISALWVVLDFVGIKCIRDVREFLCELYVPVKVIMYKVAKIPEHISVHFDVQRENKILRKQLNEYKLKKAILTDTLKELEELNKLLNIKYKSDKFSMPEKVLGYSKSIYSSNIVISKTHDVTQKNSFAVSPDGLVGMVVYTDKESAEILPITSSKIAVPVKNKSGVHLIISGTDQDKMVSRVIQENSLSSLHLGDILYTSGEGGVFHKDIPVAIISKIITSQNLIIMQPTVNISELDYVYVNSSVIDR